MRPASPFSCIGKSAERLNPDGNSLITPSDEKFNRSYPIPEDIGYFLAFSALASVAKTRAVHKKTALVKRQNLFTL